MKYLMSKLVFLFSIAAGFILSDCATSQLPDKKPEPQIENLLSQETYVRSTEPFILSQFYRSNCPSCVDSILTVDREALGNKITSVNFALVNLDENKEAAVGFFHRSIAPHTHHWNQSLWDPAGLSLNKNGVSHELPFIKLESQSGTVLWSKEGALSSQDAAELREFLSKTIRAFQFQTITPSKRRRFSALDSEVTGEIGVKTRNQKKKKKPKPQPDKPAGQ